MLSINFSGGKKEVLIYKTCLLELYRPLGNAMKLYVLTYAYT